MQTYRATVTGNVAYPLQAEGATFFYSAGSVSGSTDDTLIITPDKPASPIEVRPSQGFELPQIATTWSIRPRDAAATIAFIVQVGRGRFQSTRGTSDSAITNPEFLTDGWVRKQTQVPNLFAWNQVSNSGAVYLQLYNPESNAGAIAIRQMTASRWDQNTLNLLRVVIHGPTTTAATAALVGNSFEGVVPSLTAGQPDGLARMYAGALGADPANGKRISAHGLNLPSGVWYENRLQVVHPDGPAIILPPGFGCFVVGAATTASTTVNAVIQQL